MRIAIVGLVVMAVFAAPSHAHAYDVCIGDKQDTCGYQWKAHYKFFSCARSMTPDIAAQRLCTDVVSKRVRPYRIVIHKQAGSAACPSYQFTVSCDEQANTFRICVGEFANLCPVAYDLFVAAKEGDGPTRGENLRKAAQEGCTVIDGTEKIEWPFSMKKEGEHSGNCCGYAWYRIQCFR